MKLFVPPGCDAELYDTVQLEALLVQGSDLVDRIAEQVCEGARVGRRPHTLLVGPSGRGKTHLITTLRHRLREEDGIALAWLTAERGIGGFEDLLLRVGRSIQSPGGAIEALLDVFTDSVPATQREAALREAIVEELDGRVMVLALEDLETCLGALGPTGRQAVRAFLQEEAACILIATAARLFPAISNRKEPLFGFFAVHHLQELDDTACRSLAHASAKARGRSIGKDTEFDRLIRAVATCLGGNPRLFALLGRHAADLGTSDWKRVLSAAISELAPRYRAVSSSLSPQQQKILQYLCATQGARTVKEIATHGAMAHQTASSQLKSLRDAELVVAHAVGRESFYEVRSVLVRTVVGLNRASLQSLIERVEFSLAWPSRGKRIPEWIAAIDPSNLAAEWRKLSGQRTVPRILTDLVSTWQSYTENSDSRTLLELNAEDRHHLETRTVPGGSATA